MELLSRWTNGAQGRTTRGLRMDSASALDFCSVSAPSSRASISVIVAAVALFSVSFAEAQPREAEEYQVKAAFLANFAGFVEWPTTALSAASSELTIGVLGDDPFGPVLDDLARVRKINNRSVVIRRFDNIEDLRYCHILFIAYDDDAKIERALEALKETSTLIVGESRGFVDRGGMIGFTLQEKKIRFEINCDSAASVNIRFSANLLRLAKRIIRRSPAKEEAGP